MNIEQLAKINLEYWEVMIDMAKKGTQNSSMEQMNKDHETETAFKFDNPKKHQKRKNK